MKEKRYKVEWEGRLVGYVGECVRLCHRRLPRASHRPSSCPPVRISWLGVPANERTHTRERVPPITSGRWPSRAIFAHSNCHILRAKAYCNLHLLVLSSRSPPNHSPITRSQIFWSLNRTRKYRFIFLILKKTCSTHPETWNLNRTKKYLDEY